MERREVTPLLPKAQSAAPLHPDPWAPPEGRAQGDLRAAQRCFLISTATRIFAKPLRAQGSPGSPQVEKPVETKGRRSGEEQASPRTVRGSCFCPVFLVILLTLNESSGRSGAAHVNASRPRRERGLGGNPRHTYVSQRAGNVIGNYLKFYTHTHTCVKNVPGRLRGPSCWAELQTRAK